MTEMTLSPRTTARLAGAAYLLVIACGLFAEGAVRGTLIGPDAAGTVVAIRDNWGLFRAGLAADLTMALADVALAILLLHLLRPAGGAAALAATAFRLVQAAVIAVSLLLLALGGRLATDEATALPGQDALALLLIQAHGLGYDIGLAFFAVTAVLTGWLAARAGIVPRWTGALLMAAGPVYLAGSVIALVAPGLIDSFAPAYLVPVVAETSFCLWLLAAPRSRFTAGE